MHAASLNATEGASATAAAAGRTTRAVAVEKGAIGATEQADASPRVIGVVAVAEAELKERAEEAGRVLQEHKRRQAGRVVR